VVGYFYETAKKNVREVFFAALQALLNWVNISGSPWGCVLHLRIPFFLPAGDQFVPADFDLRFEICDLRSIKPPWHKNFPAFLNLKFAISTPAVTISFAFMDTDSYKIKDSSYAGSTAQPDARLRHPSCAAWRDGQRH
jgi:hypothetical protein